MAHVTIKDIKNFQFTPHLSVDNFDGVPAKLFGKDVLFRDDYWLRNIHIKITDRCNAKCGFCIEKDSHVKENKWNLMNNLSSLFHQMDKQGLLSTVTITGGEPSLCRHLDEVLHLVSKYKVFSSMNTTGRNIPVLKHAPNWLDISKHYFDDTSIFGLKSLSKKDIIGIKDRTGSKIRLQGLLLKGYLDSVDKILNYIDTYKDVADDFGFRQLIKSGNDYDGVSLVPFRKYLYKNAKFVEQVIQDYYVYETWNVNGKDLTLSMSDMGMLKSSEETEDAAILRELVVHPDGMVSGDWGRKHKVLCN